MMVLQICDHWLIQCIGIHADTYLRDTIDGAIEEAQHRAALRRKIAEIPRMRGIVIVVGDGIDWF